MFSVSDIKNRLSEILIKELSDTFIQFDQLDEVTMKRVVRAGQIVRKVKIKKKGFKVLRKGTSVQFVRMTQKEKRTRRKAARASWRQGKSSRKNKSKRTMIRSKVRMKQLYGK